MLLYCKRFSSTLQPPHLLPGVLTSSALFQFRGQRRCDGVRKLNFLHGVDRNSSSRRAIRKIKVFTNMIARFVLVLDKNLLATCILLL